MDKTTVLSANLYFYDLEARRLIRVYDGLIMGRTAGNEQFPDDPKMSARHVKITVSGNDAFVEDLNSSNKTYVNQRVVLPGQAIALKFNDLVEFGGQRMVYTSDKDFGAKTQLHPAPGARRAPPSATTAEPREWAHKRLGRAASSFGRFEGWDWSTLAFMAFGLVLMLVALLGVREAMQPGLPYSTVRVAAKMFLAFAVALCLAGFFNYGVARLARIPVAVRPFLWLPSFGVFLLALLGMQWVTAYPPELAANQLTVDCLRSDNAGACARGIKFQPGAYSRIPAEVKAQIAQKLAASSSR